MSKDYMTHFNGKLGSLLRDYREKTIQILGRTLAFKQSPEWHYVSPYSQYCFEAFVIDDSIIYFKEKGKPQAKEVKQADLFLRNITLLLSSQRDLYLIHDITQLKFDANSLKKKLSRSFKGFNQYFQHTYLLLSASNSNLPNILLQPEEKIHINSSLEEALIDCVKRQELLRPFDLKEGSSVQDLKQASQQDLIRIIQCLKEENQQLKQVYELRFTELKETIERLTESQEQLRSTFSSIDDAVYVFDKNHQLIFSNVKSNKVSFLNTSFDRCLGQYFRGIFSETLSDKLKTALGHVAETHEVQQFEYCLADNMVSLYFKISVNYRKDSAGRYAGFIMVARDITEEKIADKKIIESEKKYRSVVESVREVIFQTDIWGTWSFLNPAWKEISGHNIFESLEQPIVNFIQQEDQVIIEQLFQHIIQGKKDEARCEVRFINSQNKVFWADVFIKAYLDDLGRVVGTSGTLNDVTKRKKAEEILKQSNQLLESINKNIKEALIRVSHEEGLLYFNQAFIDMFGYQTSTEIQKLPLNMLFAQQEDLRSYMRILREEKTFTNKTLLFKRKDGTTFWGLSSFMLITDEDGNEFYDGAIRDITDRKEAEKKLKEKNQELVKTNEELDRFVYSASHDLRAPLASTLGLINISRLSHEERERTYYLELMEQSLNRMDKIIQDLTDYSRNARLEIETEEIDFEHMIKDIFQRLKYLKKIDDVHVNTQIEAKGKFYSDKIRLYIILINIISNAIKYHRYDQSCPYISIDITMNAENAVIKVLDNGIGIDKSHIDKIFTMFFQVSRDSVGSGLGLYIAKETINKLHGSIIVESTVSKGSVFTVTIPNAKSYFYVAEG